MKFRLKKSLKNAPNFVFLFWLGVRYLGENKIEIWGSGTPAERVFF
jgi:hypothetical protein